MRVKPIQITGLLWTDPKNSAGVTPVSARRNLLLLGLAGCTASDVISILAKKRVPLDDFEINIKADATDEFPQVFTKINLEYVFYGKGINEKMLNVQSIYRRLNTVV